MQASAFPIRCLWSGEIMADTDINETYCIALLQLHELIEAFVLSDIVVVSHDAFAVYCALIPILVLMI